MKKNQVLIFLAVIIAWPLAAISQGDKPAKVRGRVTTYFGVPLAGADIRFFLLEMEKGAYIYSGTQVKLATSDSKGQYEARGLPADEYRVTASLQGFPVAEVWRFYLPNDSDRVLDFGLKIGMTHGMEPIRIFGHVTDQDERPIEGSTVTLISTFDNTEQEQTSTDKRGRYDFGFIQPGQYVIFSTAPNYLSGSTTLFVDNRRGEKVNRKLDLTLKSFVAR